jgi:hypothetical protein
VVLHLSGKNAQGNASGPYLYAAILSSSHNDAGAHQRGARVFTRTGPEVGAVEFQVLSECSPKILERQGNEVMLSPRGAHLLQRLLI